MKCSIIYKIQHYFISVFFFFSVLFFCSLFVHKISKIYWRIPWSSGGIYFFFFTHRKGSFSSLFLQKQNKHINNTKRKILNRMKSHQIFCSIAKCYFSCADGFGFLFFFQLILWIFCCFFFKYKICSSQSAACNSVISTSVSETVWGTNRRGNPDTLADGRRGDTFKVRYWHKGRDCGWTFLHDCPKNIDSKIFSTSILSVLSLVIESAFHSEIWEKIWSRKKGTTHLML